MDTKRFFAGLSTESTPWVDTKRFFAGLSTESTLWVDARRFFAGLSTESTPWVDARRFFTGPSTESTLWVDGMYEEMQVRAKKYLGQHFLTDQEVAQRIVASLDTSAFAEDAARMMPQAACAVLPVEVLEVGPGMGVLTQYLLQRSDISLRAVEIDEESVDYLREHFPGFTQSLYQEDFLALNLAKLYGGKPLCIIGNFPYNISSQIFFKVLDNVDSIPQVVGMVQKEVAERIAAPAGSKTYGILSVLLQAWYDIEYLFTVGEGAFVPPPKVKSAVIRLRRNSRTDLGCDPAKFKAVVKTAFNQRRKTLRNSLRPLTENVPEQFSQLRPEQLGVEQFIELTNLLL